MKTIPQKYKSKHEYQIVLIYPGPTKTPFWSTKTITKIATAKKS